MCLRRVSLVLLIVGISTCLASTTALALTSMDSGAFPYQFNDVSGSPDFAVHGDALTDLGGGLVGYSNNNYIDSSAWVAQVDTITANGFTVEMRLQVTTNGAQNFGWGLMPADAGAAAQVSWIGVRTGDIMSQYGPGLISLGAGDNSGATDPNNFATVRLVYEPNATKLSLYRNGELVTDQVPAGNWTGVPFVNFGAISQVCGTGVIDYIRFTPGAFAPVPVPEPSTLALACVGLVSLLAYAWRKRK
jgi:hypothetical protein